MKRFNALKLLILFIIFNYQCSEFEPGGTNTEEFAGSWYFQIYDNQNHQLLDYGYEDDYLLLTYNTSRNKPGEIWIEDEKVIPLKAKFQLIGNSSYFKGEDVFSLNEYIMKQPLKKDAINLNNGDTINVYVQFLYAKLLEGKILPNAATLWKDLQKAKADSIYLKFVFVDGYLQWIVNKIISVKDTITDTIIYFTPSQNFYIFGDPIDTLIIQGHRQTGWEVHF